MRFWIVTPSFNQAPFLRQTLASVLSQTGVDVRHFVVDGGSTDGSVDVLRSTVDNRLSWTSGPDGGQADAVNKGLTAVDLAGCRDDDVVGWLNSDDLYLPGALATMAAAFADPAVSWAVGRYRVIDVAGLPVRSAIVRYKERQLRRYAYRRLLRENVIPQPAVFWRAAFGRSVGGLDPSLHFTMDYDLWLRMAQRSAPTIVGHEVAAFRVHDRSKTGRINRAQFDEGYQVARRHAHGDRASLLAHRLNVEKIVWAYRLLSMIGR